MWYRIDTGTIAEGPIRLPLLWAFNDVQYPLRELSAKGHDLDVIALGWLPEVIITTAKSDTEKVTGYTRSIVGNTVEAVEQIGPKTAEEIASDTATAEAQADQATVTADATIKALITARPAAIETYIDNNVTDLESAKDVLKILAKTVHLLAARMF